MAARRKDVEFTDAVDGKLSDVVFGTPPPPPANPNVVARPIDITQIVPDWTQPRRVIPSSVREMWNGSPETTPELFDAWIGMAGEELGIGFANMKKYVNRLLRGDELDPSDKYSLHLLEDQSLRPLEKALLEVVNLAASIRRDGLTNPITIVNGNPHLIETGERRWLAFHLLAIYDDAKKYAAIPARLVDGLNVWKQATENNVRVDLNAIGKARQLAILIMDLYRQEGATWMQYADFDHDRHFYAQVADGNLWRVPRGRSGELLNAMGLKDPGQLRKYRDLLRLPDAVWTIADDLNWAEQFIRERVVAKAANENQMAQIAARFAQEQGYTVPVGTVSEGGEDDYTVTVVTVSEGKEAATPKTSAEFFYVGEWVQADVGDHLLQGQCAGYDEDGKVRVNTEKGPARLWPEKLTRIAPPAQSYINSEPVSAPPQNLTPQPPLREQRGGALPPVSVPRPPAAQPPQRDTAAEQERIERRVLHELEDMKTQTAYYANGMKVEKLKTQGGKNHANSIISQMEAVLADLRRRME